VKRCKISAIVAVATKHVCNATSKNACKFIFNVFVFEYANIVVAATPFNYSRA
jgi:hypothetical protein